MRGVGKRGRNPPSFFLGSLTPHPLPRFCQPHRLNKNDCSVVHRPKVGSLFND